MEQQEVRQMEMDKRKEEQRLELLQMKQQNDMMLFGLLNNLTNCLNSLHKGSNNQSAFMNQGIYNCVRVTRYALRIMHLLYFALHI